MEKEAAKGSNFVASPLSVHVVLSLAAAGSTSHTLKQFLHFLKSNSVSDLNIMSSMLINVASPIEGSDKNLAGGPLLSFVNGAWLDQRFPLKSTFQQILKATYKAEPKNVDFLNKAEEVVQEVNLWAETETKGLIKQLLPTGSLDKYTVLVLANALYFKGAWDQKFDPSMTQLRDFHLLNGQTVRVPFMTNQSFMGQLYGSFNGFKLLKIPYQSGQDPRKFSMYFFLPNEKDGLLSLIQKIKLNPGLLNQRYHLWYEDLAHFWIPKFKFSSEFEASETMKEMGLKLPFKSGELTEMVDSPYSDDLFVSRVFHKSFIEVNEEGAEASASTAVKSQMLCARIVTPSFVADHPFLFVIKEETHGIIFFIGAVLNPLLDA
ncbi:serpin-ZX [Ziziphus jujuba]|uniref:Serpin-ZX n=1 Tax=Ziziphus jujuba TaxID=326968 RepID=A0A6P3ZKQ7_ZIZJJ|nr:serpin-ZX [Ziziphus jujuba]